MSLFRLNASIRVEGSHSREIADIVEREWRANHPDQPVVVRDVGLDPVPATAWPAAVATQMLPPDQVTDEQRAGGALAATLTDELLAADELLFAVPLYNFGVSQHFKAWVDMIFVDPRMRPPAKFGTEGKPAVLVTVRGGNYSPGTPREGWDHATAYMRRVLQDCWLLDLKVVESQFTFVDIDPSLAQFKDMAAQFRADAEVAAHECGRSLGSVLAGSD
jgi:FMN-dependent NADH-azoreductase